MVIPLLANQDLMPMLFTPSSFKIVIREKSFSNRLILNVFKGLQIEVFGRHCWQIPKILWSFGTKDAVIDLLVDTNENEEPKRVFASLANGTVVVFQRTPCNGESYASLSPNGDEDKDMALEMEKSEWKEATVCPNFLLF